MNIINLTARNSGERIDRFLSKDLENLSRSYLQKLLKDGDIIVNGKVVKANYKVSQGDEIQVSIPEPETPDILPENIPLDILYEDDDILVVNKPKGMVVHPAPGHYSHTLVNAVMYHCGERLSGINGVLRPGIVHRIDKNTSGLLVVAKNDAAHLSLSKQIEDKTCKRVYVALLEGVVKKDEGVIETHIARSEKDRTKMAVSSRGRLAVTDYKVLKRYAEYTLTEFSLRTGRTHQIRVHAKYINHPVVGDKEYGYKRDKFHLNGQLLHAKELELTHPRTGERMRFTAPLPAYFADVLKKLR